MNKKWIFILFASLLLLTGCTGSGYNSETATDMAIKVHEEIITESPDVDNVLTYFSSAAQKQLTPEQIGSAISTYRNIVGNFENRKKPTEKEIEGGYTITIPVENTKRPADEDFIFKKNGELSGIFFRYGSIKPYEEEHFIETPLDLELEEGLLPGALVLPKGVENPTIALIIPGSGPNDMDETIGKEGNTPLKDIAYGLAKNGIGSYRMDKISAHFQPKSLTLDWEYYTPVKKALELLRQQPELAQSKIYLVGHSQGAMVAPTIAKQDNNIDGLVLLAGSLRTLDEIIYDQNVDLLERTDELTEKEKEKQLSYLEKEIRKIEKVKESDTDVILGTPASYWYSGNTQKSKADIQAFQGPILVLQGEEDFQVSVEKDFEEYKTILGDNSEFILYPDLSHLFMKVPSKPTYTTDDYNEKDQVSEDVIRDLSQWILSK